MKSMSYRLALPFVTCLFLGTSAGCGDKTGTQIDALGGAGDGTFNPGGVAGTVNLVAGESGGAAGTLGTAGDVGPAAGTDGATAGTGVDVDSGVGGDSPNTAPGFVNLAPPMGAPLDGVGTTLTPPAPEGWVWYEIEGALCRDGSKTGFFVHEGSANKLLIFLEGGGACSNDHFCAFNPGTAAASLSGTGQTVIGSTIGVVPDRQQPGVYADGSHKTAPQGIHDLNNPANPFKDWSQVYVPYCTGDVFFGTLDNGSVPGLSGQKFLGYRDMQLFMGRIVPTFQDKVDHVVLAGSSAGSFGAALNASMVQDSFGEVPVDLIMDSGLPFSDKYMPVCMQERWREQWGLNAALPPDCTECQQADGGGFLGLADFMLRKHPNMKLAALSGAEDEVMRLFFSSGLKDCAAYDTADPVAIVLGQFDPTVYYPAKDYTAAIEEVKTKYVPTGRLATYLIGAPTPNYHEHLFRSELYTAPSGGVTEAQFVADFIEGKMQQITP